MKAMVLAAGFGERLLPLTQRLPKPAIPVLGRPMALQILRQLADAGVDRAVLNLHYLPDVLREVLRREASPDLPELVFSHEQAILGTGGGLRRAAPELRGAGPILVCNGDFLADIDLHAVLKTHHDSGMEATLVLAPPQDGFSRVEIDDGGQVLSLAGHPELKGGTPTRPFLFTGCHVLNESILDRIPDREQSCIVRDVYQDLAAGGRLGSFVHDGFWWEFGSPLRYLEGSLKLLDAWRQRRQRVTEHDPVRELDDAIAAVGAGAKCEDHTRLRGRVALGFASHVGEGSVLEDSIVMPESWVGPGCRLVRSVVAQGVELPAGMAIEDSLVCADDGTLDDPGPGVERVNGLLVYRLQSS